MVGRFRTALRNVKFELLRCATKQMRYPLEIFLFFRIPRLHDDSEEGFNALSGLTRAVLYAVFGERWKMKKREFHVHMFKAIMQNISESEQ